MKTNMVVFHVLHWSHVSGFRFLGQDLVLTSKHLGASNGQICVKLVNSHNGHQRASTTQSVQSYGAPSPAGRWLSPSLNVCFWSLWLVLSCSFLNSHNVLMGHDWHPSAITERNNAGKELYTMHCKINIIIFILVPGRGGGGGGGWAGKKRTIPCCDSLPNKFILARPFHLIYVQYRISHFQKCFCLELLNWLNIDE